MIPAIQTLKGESTEMNLLIASKNGEITSVLALQIPWIPTFNPNLCDRITFIQNFRPGDWTNSPVLKIFSDAFPSTSH